jgi:hypothetical protein
MNATRTTRVFLFCRLIVDGIAKARKLRSTAFVVFAVCIATACESKKACTYNIDQSVVAVPCHWVERANNAQQPANITVKLHPFSRSGELKGDPSPGPDFKIWLTASRDLLSYGRFYEGFELSEGYLRSLGPLPTQVTVKNSRRPSGMNLYDFEIDKDAGEWVVITHVDTSMRPVPREQASSDEALTWRVKYAQADSFDPVSLKSCRGHDSCLVELQLSEFSVKVFLRNIAPVDHPKILRAIQAVIRAAIDRSIDPKSDSISDFLR